MTEPTDDEIAWLAIEEGIKVRTRAGVVKLARAVLAKWGQPAQAAEPVAWLVPCLQTFKGVKRVHFTRAPGCTMTDKAQPVAREPLTDEQVFAAIRGINSLDALAVWRSAETAHGIKGGQHVGNVD